MDFTKEGKKGNDPNLSAWATRTLPTLQVHLQMPGDLQAGMKKKS